MADHDTDRTRFFDSVEDLLAAPLTKNGPTNVPHSAHYRTGTFAPGIRLAVAAELEGRMQVILNSDDDRRKPDLRRLGEDYRAGRLVGIPDEPTPAYRMGDKGKRVYFGFDWPRQGSFTSELERVEGMVRWFVSIKSRLS